MNINDTVYALIEYTLYRGTVVKINNKTITIDFPAQHFSIHFRSRIKKEKVAAETESIAVIWETWKGVNGRGGYRIERELYPEYRMPARDWPHQGWIKELSVGVIDTSNPTFNIY